MSTDAWPDVWTSAVDTAAATTAGLSPSSFEGMSVPPDAVTGPGFHPDASTDAGISSDGPVTHPALDGDPEATRVGGAAVSRPILDDSPGPLSPGQPFGPRYHIVRLLGIGGMGAVYQAWDAELGVIVALKVIRPEFAQDPKAAAMLERRFKQELLLARQVTHKNVVRIHELGEIDGIKFITMPFIEGEELATVIQRGEKLPIGRVLRIARGIASGLEAAHAAGVVHRDLKPANIMVDGSDEALIMDFGVARSTGGTRPGAVEAAALFQPAAWTTDRTMAGAVVGTIEYMAPEQARAQPVDQRADIYAFGLIVYDMLLGRPRVHSSDTALAELSSRMQAAPPPVRSIDATIAEPLDRLVTRCIQPDAAARYQTTPELVGALDRLDDRGYLRPVVRRVTRRLVALVAGVVLALLSLTWWFARGPAAPVQHDPVSVLIADFQNLSNDATFTGTLEPILKLALEGAGFISAYDRSGMRTLGVPPQEKLDDVAAREIAVKQGLGVVLSGSVERQGGGYRVSVKAIQPVTGDVITSVSGRASNKDQVLGVATTLATEVREALGDRTSDAAQRFAMDTLSATSLEVVPHYAAAMQALSNGKFEEARQSFSKAVALDPTFGIGYHGLAVASRNLGKHQDAEKYAQEAVRHLDSMTERERYRTRGFFYSITNDYQACVTEYGELVARYAADVAAQNQLAYCSSQLRNMPVAIEGMRRAAQILPNRSLYRLNLSLYAAYGSDFETSEREARATLDLNDPWGLQGLAFAQTGLGQLSQAAATYEMMGKAADLGPSYTASGLGDLAIYEGRFSDAVRILEAGVATDLADKNPDRAAAKFLALAYTWLQRQQNRPAIAAAEKALANSKVLHIRFLAARIFVEAGETAKGRALAAELGSELQAAAQAYAKIVEGAAALKTRDARQAVKSLTEANALLDTWIGRLDLGRAYLEAGAFTQADSEFDRCIKRRGEALSLFLDEEPTYGYLPSVYYYQGRVREGLKSAGFAESYRTYLSIREKAGEDPLLPDVRRRITQ
jgi:eukaryotic-like serine/threonine-protein kinase